MEWLTNKIKQGLFDEYFDFLKQQKQKVYTFCFRQAISFQKSQLSFVIFQYQPIQRQKLK